MAQCNFDNSNKVFPKAKRDCSQEARGAFWLFARLSKLFGCDVEENIDQEFIPKSLTKHNKQSPDDIVRQAIVKNQQYKCQFGRYC